jgi:hypothetical protein
MTNRNIFMIGAIMVFSGAVIGCQPKTPAEKVMNKVDDAAHEAGQAVERAGDKVKDATN